MPYIEPDEVREQVDFLEAGDDPVIESVVAEFEPIAERYLGVSFLPREDVAFTGYARNGFLELPHIFVTSVETLTLDGIAVTRVDDDLDVAAGRLCGLWSRSVPYVASYTHGLAAPTPGVLAACVEYVRWRIKSMESGQSRNVISQGDGQSTTRYSTPDWHAGRPTGFLQVDALLNSERSYLIRVY